MFSKKSPGTYVLSPKPVKLLQAWNVSLNILLAGEPDKFPNNPDGIEPVKPLQPWNVA